MAGTVAGECQLARAINLGDRFQAASSSDRLSRRDPKRNYIATV